MKKGYTSRFFKIDYNDYDFEIWEIRSDNGMERMLYSTALSELDTDITKFPYIWHHPSLYNDITIKNMVKQHPKPKDHDIIELTEEEIFVEML